MQAFLDGLLRDLERRCTVLRERLAAIPADPDVRDHALSGYQEIESIRREAVQLLHDPDLGAPSLLSVHLRSLQELEQRARFVESYVLPFVERYSEPDRRLTRLCRRLAEQVGWPLPPPLVTAFSSEYYWTLASFNLICAPAAAGTALLDLPDLCHELGHILLQNYEVALVGDFVQQLARYIAQEQQRVDTGQRPPGYRPLYAALFAQWRDRWLWEFVCDMVATYLVGPAFGWQHIRLCVGRGQLAYNPALGEVAEHPADEARLRGVVAVLEYMGAQEAGARMRELWERYLAVSGERQPADYEVCYPQGLLESLAQLTVTGCQALGLRGFTAFDDPASDIARLLDEAWERFLADPQTYVEWERERLEVLWRDLGFSQP